MAPTKHEQEIAQLRHERDAERKAHDQMRHQLILANNQLQTTEEWERATEADLVAAKLRIEELETLETLEKEVVVQEVGALKIERKKLKNEVGKLETRVAELVVERDALRRSSDRIKANLETLIRKIRTMTKAASKNKSKTSSNGPEKIETAPQLIKGIPSSLYADQSGRGMLLQRLADLYELLQRIHDIKLDVSDEEKRYFQIYRELEVNHKSTIERWREQRKEVIKRLKGIQDKVDTSQGLDMEISDMFEDIIHLQAHVRRERQISKYCNKRYKLRKLQHENALKLVEECRRAASESAVQASRALDEKHQELEDQIAFLTQKHSKLNDDHIEMREIYDKAMKNYEQTVNELQRCREENMNLVMVNMNWKREQEDFLSRRRVMAEKRRELTKSRDLEISRYKDQIDVLTRRLSQIGALCSAPVSTSQDA